MTKYNPLFQIEYELNSNFVKIKAKNNVKGNMNKKLIK